MSKYSRGTEYKQDIVGAKLLETFAKYQQSVIVPENVINI